jgi:predicted transcriptional regulator
MDAADRKLSLIKWLSDVEDDALLKRIEALAAESKRDLYRQYLQPQTEADLQRLVQESEADYKAGKTLSHEEVMAKYKNRK